MIRKQFESLVIHHFSEEEFHLPLHRHTYYELIYIVNGDGLHICNGQEVRYRSGDFFLIAPVDEHYFKIGKRTEFVFIKFTEHFFTTYRSLSPEDYRFSKPEEIMQNPLLKVNPLKMSKLHCKILKNIMQNVMLYDKAEKTEHSPLMYYQILSIFGLIKECCMDAFSESAEKGKGQFFNYIHNHIKFPDKLKIKVIAPLFGISEKYFSNFFLNTFGTSYTEYIKNYKLQLIEKQLQSGKRISEVAYHFGFKDTSHFTHFFKKNKGVSPKGFCGSVGWK